LNLKKHLWLLFISFIGICSYASNGDTNKIIDAKLPILKFAENKGQWNSNVLYKAEFPGCFLFLEKNKFTYLFYSTKDLNEAHDHFFHTKEKKNLHEKFMINCHTVQATFLGANPDPVVSASEKQDAYNNYYLGNDSSHWATNVGLFSKVNYKNLYPGISTNVYSKDKNLKYDFIIDPSADPSLIKIIYTGSDKIRLRKGNLEITTSVNDIIEQRPYAYQIIRGEKKEVNCSYTLNDDVVSFVFPDGYDIDFPLVIDPVVVASTYSGSTETTYGHCATFDNLGNIYTGGRCFGLGYPITVGAFQTSFSGSVDIAISKLNPSGSSLIFATFVGGNDDEYAQSLFVNNSGDLYIYGSSASTNYPTLAGSYHTTFYGGYCDIVVTKLNSTGTALLGSTYIGGSDDDGQNVIFYNYGDEFRGEIVVDANDNAYIASFTSSTNFPTTPGCYDNTYNGGSQDAVVFELNSNLSQLLWSTYLGGSGDDAAYGLRLTSFGGLYVVGGTSSTDFPVTIGCYQSTFQGGSYDGFISYLSNNGSILFPSSYYGTSSFDEAFFVDLDAGSNVYLYGLTEGTITPTTGVYSNPGSKQFITKLDQSLIGVIYSTVFGDGTTSSEFSPTAFLVDVCENVYAAGWGSTTGFPVSGNAVQPTTDGSDFYLMVLKKDALLMLYATYYGDPNAWEHVDGGTSRFDKNGIVYEAVCAGGTNFPTMPGSYSVNNQTGGSWDIAVFKIDFQSVGVIAQASALPNATGCAPLTVNFSNTSVNAVSYIWNFNDGSPLNNSASPSHVFTTPGVYNVLLIAIDSTTCNISDSITLTITVTNGPLVNLGNDTTICGVPNIILDAGNPGGPFLWSTGATTQTINITMPGTFWVAVGTTPCIARDTIIIGLVAPPPFGSDTTVCSGNPVVLNAGNPGSTYQWSTGALTQSITVNTSGMYYVTISAGTCNMIDSILVTMAPFPIVNLGNDTVLCPNQTLTLDAGNPGSTYQWSTGATTQSIVVSSAGMIRVTVTTGSCSTTDSIHVNTIQVPLELGNDTSLCQGQTLTINGTSTSGSTYQWSTGAITPTINVSTTGLFEVTVSFEGCSNTDSIRVTFIPVPTVNLGKDTVLCPEQTITLNAGNPGFNYQWSTGATTQSITVGTTGFYWVNVYNGSCEISDTIFVSVMQPLELGAPISICGKGEVVISAGSSVGSYLWSTGETTSYITVTEPGFYWVSIHAGICEFHDTVEVYGTPGMTDLLFPNTFTPNKDGLNDIFTGVGTDVTYFKLMIFDRWGELICTTEDREKGWDGRFKGDKVPVDYYVYVCDYKVKCTEDRLIRKMGGVFVFN